MKRVAFVTSRDWPHLTQDDRVAIPACQRAGFDVIAAEWSDPGVDWRAFDAVVLRSTWDYHLRAAEFHDWLARLEQSGTPIGNPVTVLRWNAHKGYLLALAAGGIATPQTRLVPRSSIVELAGFLDELGWNGVVLKPAVSASSHRTHLVRATPTAEHQRALNAILAESDALVQEFVPEVATAGEWAMVFFGGRFSHAVCRQPQRGDFRVQEELGGTITAGTPPTGALLIAERALAAAPGPTLYARVDVVVAARAPLLMELELLEPAVYFGYDEGSAERFAAALHGLVSHQPP